MPIAHKSLIQSKLKALDESYTNLISSLDGASPNGNIWDSFSLSESDFKRDFTEIDPEKLTAAIGSIEALIKDLKKTNSLKAKRLHRV